MEENTEEAEVKDDKFQIYRDDYPLLIEAGFVAVKQLDEISATRIFQAAQALSPNNTAPKIGMGYIALNKLDTKEANEIFEKVLEQEPDNYLAMTFLGMSYLLTKGRQQKGEKLIKESMEKTTDPTIKYLGAELLKWNETKLKKSASPFFSP